MTDLELTKACADAMGDPLIKDDDGKLMESGGYYFIDSGIYDPLTDDKQAMALVKRLQLAVYWIPDSEGGWAASYDFGPNVSATNADLNRAIVECVAAMQTKE